MSKSEISFDEHGSWIWKDGDAREPNLILFIHGYTGNPNATWANFPHLIRQAGRGFERGFDVASFGYKSKLVFNFRRKIGTIAELLLTFIDAHAHENKNVFIVAHSLGGLVTRRFLVETFNRPDQCVFFQKVRRVHFRGTEPILEPEGKIFLVVAERRGRQRQEPPGPRVGAFPAQSFYPLLSTRL